MTKILMMSERRVIGTTPIFELMFVFPWLPCRQRDRKPELTCMRHRNASLCEIGETFVEIRHLPHSGVSAAAPVISVSFAFRNHARAAV
jgi:hypothetical protein